MKVTISELAEGDEQAVKAWINDIIEAAGELTRKHRITLIGGETLIGDHRQLQKVDKP